MHRIHPKIRKRVRRLRRDQTPEENIMWARLRGRRLSGLKFYRQHPIGPFIADFCCPEHRLVVELDGGDHTGQQDTDQRRTDWLSSQGYTAIRFTNQEVQRQPEAVLVAIRQACLGDEGG